jgi:hypothetical protein
MCSALFSYVWRHGEQCHGADGRPGESCSNRGVVAHHVLVQEQLRGWWRSGWLSGRRHGPIRGCRQRGSVSGTVAGVATSRPRALQQRRVCRCSARRGTAVAGIAAQG